MKAKLSVVMLAVVLLVSAGYPGEGDAGVDVHVGVSVSLPRVVLHSPPAVVLIPGTYVYFVPDIDADILFYGGHWYRPYKGYWYRAVGYNGPWVHTVNTKVPRVLIDLPPDFRRVPAGHQRIPYGQLKKHWKTWEKERYWDRRERMEDVREERRERREDRREFREGKGKGRGKHSDD